MCYNKEVQLATSLIILVSTAAYYFIFHTRYMKKSSYLVSVLSNVLLVFACIGMHQLFEFFVLLTKNELIYKTGLVISLSATYFLLRSLEKLTNRGMHSKLAIIIIAIIAIHIFSVPMTFEGVGFYVRHSSAFFWASAWMLLFIYWHVCAIRYFAVSKDSRTKKAVLLYIFSAADISFILAAAYTIAGYFLFGTNVCSDSPSIWCTFYVVQAAYVPIFLARLPSLLKLPEKNGQTIKQTIAYLLISAIILLLCIAVLPFFSCLTTKFVFP